MDRKIGVFDSGLGGLSILKEMIELMPNEEFLFYEDSINNPYGNKSELIIFKLASNAVDFLIDNDCKIIVIACNTATTACMEKLRNKYPDMIFVGTVPAIKVAYDMKCKSTLLLSTDYTMNSKRIQELIQDFKNDDQELINISGKDLAHLIEIGNDEKIEESLKQLLEPYKNKIDSIVLGCTHYSLIKKKIMSVIPGVKIFDSCYGVACEVRRQLKNHNLESMNSGNNKVIIVNNKDDSLVERSYKILFERDDLK